MTHQAILPAETEDLSHVANELAARSIYLTCHEVEWLNDLARRHRWDTLRALRGINARRSWDGPGMAVNGEKVEQHLGHLLRGRK